MCNYQTPQTVFPRLPRGLAGMRLRCLRRAPQAAPRRGLPPSHPTSPPHLSPHTHTTAGVPCLTLTGACHAHNVGASLLTAVGLQEEWVARSGGEGAARCTALRFVGLCCAAMTPRCEGCRARLRPSCKQLFSRRFPPAAPPWIRPAASSTSPVACRSERVCGQGGTADRRCAAAGGAAGGAAPAHAAGGCCPAAGCRCTRGAAAPCLSPTGPGAPSAPAAPPALQSQLCDAPTFVRQLEGVYRRLWLRWLERQRRETAGAEAAGA